MDCKHVSAAARRCILNAMGSINSKSSKRKSTKSSANRRSSEYQTRLDDTTNKHDQEAINKLREELLGDPDMFIINHVLMGLMFFENYEK